MNHQQYFDRRVIAEPHGLLEFRLAPGKTAEIVEIEVESKHRRMGVGQKMIARMLSELSAGTHVYAFTRRENAIALQFYKSQGFELRPLPGFYPDGDGAVCWKVAK